MAWVAARRVVALVADKHFIVYPSVVQSVSNSVRPQKNTGHWGVHAITSIGFCALPIPAGIFCAYISPRPKVINAADGIEYAKRRISLSVFSLLCASLLTYNLNVCLSVFAPSGPSGIDIRLGICLAPCFLVFI
jgi:hypothetical protein